MAATSSVCGVRDVTHGSQVRSRAMVVQRKTQRPVQFELTEPPSRLSACLYPSVCEDRRALGGGCWPGSFRLRHALYTANEGNIHYKRTKNLRAVQLLLGYSELESTVRYLGFEVDDALEISEQIEI